MSEYSPKAGSAAPLPGENPARQGLDPTDAMAIILSLVWLTAVGGYFLIFGSGGEGGAAGLLQPLLAVFVPITLVWIAAAATRSARVTREEIARLQASVDALRQAFVAQGHAAARDTGPAVERRLQELVAAQRRTEATLATFTSRRESAQTAPSADHRSTLSVVPPEQAEAQPALALGTPAEMLREPVQLPDFLRALNFPETAQDKAGFRALRRALDDPRAAKVIRSAQDVLTLLSEDGIYMDDLSPDRARPEVWRRFAQGRRGGEVAALGGVRDRELLSRAAARMREDAVFRDAAHHFLRQFDQMLESLEKNATDQDLVDLAETRSARAFMLVGRVAGIFD